jgi:hypothetical protein
MYLNQSYMFIMDMGDAGWMGTRLKGRAHESHKHNSTSWHEADRKQMGKPRASKLEAPDVTSSLREFRLHI